MAASLERGRPVSRNPNRATWQLEVDEGVDSAETSCEEAGAEGSEPARNPQNRIPRNNATKKRRRLRQCLHESQI